MGDVALDTFKKNIKHLEENVQQRISFSNASQPAVPESGSKIYKSFPSEHFHELNSNPGYIISDELIQIMELWTRHELKYLQYFQRQRQLQDDNRILDLMVRMSTPLASETPSLSQGNAAGDLDFVEYTKTIVGSPVGVRRR